MTYLNLALVFLRVRSYRIRARNGCLPPYAAQRHLSLGNRSAVNKVYHNLSKEKISVCFVYFTFNLMSTHVLHCDLIAIGC